ncbi:MAG: ornithine carbamoyltransferase [Acidimicrobiia bacterium]|nr:ornithine carbamoyltransferase [Acidimicrobiia bacterium]
MDFVNVADLGPDGLQEVLALAADVKTNRSEVAGSRPGLRVGLFFEKPSTRTRVSCEVASADLGMVPLVLKQDEVGLGKRESVEDVGRVLDRYLDVLAFRVFDHQNLMKMAAITDAPVINLLSDLEHPCQALADLQTVAEHRPLPGATVAFIGDGNNVCNSLMIAGAMMGTNVRVASPDGNEPTDEMLAAARAGASGGATIAVTNDPAEAVAGADVVYTDVWASMGQEDEAAERRRRFQPYQVNLDLFEKAQDDAVFMHCLPAHRGDEVTDDVADHSRSRIFDQAENRMHAFKALLLYLTAD